jgi:hypothetical protein
MKIHSNMNLEELAERMGDIATRRDAVMMRECLVAWFDNWETYEVSDYHWNNMLAMVAAQGAT